MRWKARSEAPHESVPTHATSAVLLHGPAQAFDAYYARSGLPVGDEWVDYSYTVWNASPWGQGAEVSLAGYGFPALTFAVGGSEPDFTVLTERRGAALAPLCHASATPWRAACLFGSDLGVLRASAAFTLHPKATVNPGTVTTLQVRQILKGFAALGASWPTVQAAIADTDGSISVQGVTSDRTDHDPFTMYTFSQGDTPMGFVYTMDSLELVAVIEDMAINQCIVR